MDVIEVVLSMIKFERHCTYSHVMRLIRLVFLFVLLVAVHPLISMAQSEDPLWLDIGELHNLYVPAGALHEAEMNNLGMQWPGNLRLSGHTRAEGFWIGLKNWTDEEGELHEYKVLRNGPRTTTDEYVTMEHRLVSRWPETVVRVQGEFGGLNEQVIDDVDPDLPADRAIISRIRTSLGIEVERTAYAFGNPYHDDYHIIERTFTNTGNTDADDELELFGQQVTDTYFFNIWRWTGRGAGCESRFASTTMG